MKKINLATIDRFYKNNGQEAERVVRYTLTGQLERADNRQGADCLDYQIKTSKASICKGTDIRAHVACDGCKEYIYVLADFSAGYIMDKSEYVTFIDMFAHTDKDSNGKNLGGVKLRLKTENKVMREWLASHSAHHFWIDPDNGNGFELYASNYAEAEMIVASRGYCVSDCIIWEWA